MSPLLEVTGLTVSFPGSHGGASVVRGVSLSVDAGETVALVGESGSGKTVTALAVMGLLPRGEAYLHPGSSVLIGGREMVGGAESVPRELRGGTVGMVFQDTGGALNPVRRVGSQLLEVLKRHRGLRGRAARVEAEHLLDEVGLPDPRGVAEAFPHQLSGGMRQRALLALALAGEPRLLVADEPTSALDPTVQLQVLDLVAALTRSRRLGTLLITHDFGVVAHASDRVVVMYAGEVVEEGPTEAVLRAPDHPYTRGLMAALPGRGRRREPFAAIPGFIPPPQRRDQGCVFRDRCLRAGEECVHAPEALPRSAGGGSVRCWRPGGGEP